MPSTLQSTVPQYWAIGRLASMYRLPVPRVRSLLQSDGVAPAYYEDDVDHYDDLARRALAAHVHDEEGES